MADLYGFKGAPFGTAILPLLQPCAVEGNSIMSYFSFQAHDPDFLPRLIQFIRAMLAMDLHQPTDWTSGQARCTVGLFLTVPSFGILSLSALAVKLGL